MGLLTKKKMKNKERKGKRRIYDWKTLTNSELKEHTSIIELL